MPRYDSVVLNRLRIGHSRLTHSYLLYEDDPPNLSILWNSTYSETYISGMCQPAGHS